MKENNKESTLKRRRGFLYLTEKLGNRGNCDINICKILCKNIKNYYPLRRTNVEATFTNTNRALHHVPFMKNQEKGRSIILTNYGGFFTKN